ncbi:MAG: tetratricopeptide repeat protein [Gammaproteobacteria bacterium]|nr:MAG: tetratricopeptide repeat protein [Gammaproteobacteria bacterium]
MAGHKEALSAIAALLQAGRTAEAFEALQRVIALDPNDAVALNELGNLHWHAGRIAAANACYERILARDPANSVALCNHANALLRLGRPAEAAAACERGLARQPDAADLRFALACSLGSLGHPQRAVTLYQELARQQPAYPGLQLNLGAALMRLGRCQEAIDCYDRAIATDPQDFRAHNNRGNALREQQRMAEAVVSFRRALAIRPDHATAHSNLLLTLNYTETTQEPIYRESLQFEARQGAPLRSAALPFANTRDPGRPLRVGYVSADFRRHSVAYFLRGVLAAHDPRQVVTHCYASVEAPDEMTTALQALAAHWRAIAGLSDEAVAQQVRADGIDILVDLGGHTGGHRLLVFARRAAPVQVSWLGYPNTTGLQAMDYRLTDDVADPPGAADTLHTERLVRLPGGFLCYQPGAVPAAVAVAAPCGVTFGSFNTLAKVTPAVIAAWAQILHRAAGSRLLLKSDALNDVATRRRLLAQFAGHGIDAGRIELLAWVTDYPAHLALYGRVDLALDTFPYNGTTTTCEALWMGVPVLVMRGNRHAARVGASIMTHAGLPEWIAENEDEYIALAVARAADAAALANARAGISERMRGSSLADPVRFTATLERAYREQWTAWCQTGHQPGC